MARITYTLSDGIVIEAANNTRNRSGYNHVAVTLLWSKSPTTPFAATGRVNGKSTYHGHFADVREAAYVAAAGGISSEFAGFPSDLYNLPVTLTAEQGVAALAR